jgi:hypothetical protein
MFPIETEPYPKWDWGLWKSHWGLELFGFIVLNF